MPIRPLRAAARRPLATALLLALLAIGLLPATARAGGLELVDRGTRPLGQGFASVAAPDDPDALWYNPAGLVDAGRQFLGGASLLWMRADFARLDGGGNQQPAVSLEAPLLPLPTLAYSDPLGSRRWTFGVGLFTPSAVLFRWPESIVEDGVERPAPQRYSLYSLEGSALVHLVLGAAFRPSRQLAVGIAPVLVLGAFQSRVALSTCDGVVCAAPEDPEYDAVAEVRKDPVVGPSLSAGLQWRSAEGTWRLGASVRLPVVLLGPATIRLRMPDAALFDEAYLDGDAVDFDFGLPLVVRVGAQWRPTARWRLDVAAVYEHWAAEERIRIAPAEDIWVRGIRIIEEYQMGPVDVPRNMRPVLSVRLGGQWAPGQGDGLWLRAGLMAENSSFSDAYLTPMTLDSDKLVATLGASVRLSEAWWLDAAYGHVFLRDRTVRDSRVYQPSALRPPRSPDVPPNAGGAVPIGNGDYAMEADMVSVAVRWRPGGAARPAAAEMPEEGAGSEDDGPDARRGEPPREDASRRTGPAGPSQRRNGSRPWWQRGTSGTSRRPADRASQQAQENDERDEPQGDEHDDDRDGDEQQPQRRRRPSRPWWQR